MLVNSTEPDQGDINQYIAPGTVYILADEWKHHADPNVIARAKEQSIPKDVFMLTAIAIAAEDNNVWNALARAKVLVARLVCRCKEGVTITRDQNAFVSSGWTIPRWYGAFIRQSPTATDTVPPCFCQRHE
jgi:hypothetical protein